ncbi:hypothetical protein OG500_06580 [Kitasatospora sp. NBC_01250]|uniref:hypothetical protein n=1 Tax=unclassified Kitasatospora TaxID=2633591 RepID=UPI002E0FC92A|nr:MULTISPECIES: hypothetical protein [unclassified Kitasatospora]WSJ65778.1 hypothetical protein OG294_06450 [Kitasatospora sp. NBC_01302]
MERAEPEPVLVSRRAALRAGVATGVLGASGALGAAGCGGGGGGGAGHPGGGASSPTASGAAPGAPTSRASGTAAAGLPATRPWVPGPGEIQPDVKLRAVQLVEALGSWPSGGSGTAAAQARVTALGGLDPALADQAGPLLPSADRAALQVIDAQYGGILADSASVLVVCDQWTGAAGSPSAVARGGTTVDVRLSAAAPRWTVTALHPAAPGPVAATVSAAAGRVLANSRIELPPAALADVRSGAVHDSVLEAMLTLARTYTMSVSVVRSGHPLDVFGTDRPSDHPLGRAFDVWRINGLTVVDPGTPHDLVDGFMRAAAAAGSYNVGGPRQLSGGGTPNQFFTDDTHHDHVHAGFTG